MLTVGWLIVYLLNGTPRFKKDPEWAIALIVAVVIDMIFGGYCGS